MLYEVITFGQCLGLEGLAVEHDHEFVAAPAGQQVRGPDGGQDALRNGAQDVVALDVAVAVVDFLEGVQVDEDDRERRAVAVGLVRGDGEPVFEGAPVGRAGERVALA